MKVIVKTQPYVYLLPTVLMKLNTDDLLNSPDLIFYNIDIFLISTVRNFLLTFRSSCKFVG